MVPSFNDILGAHIHITLDELQEKAGALRNCCPVDVGFYTTHGRGYGRFGCMVEGVREREGGYISVPRQPHPSFFLSGRARSSAQSVTHGVLFGVWGRRGSEKYRASLLRPNYLWKRGRWPTAEKAHFPNTIQGQKS